MSTRTIDRTSMTARSPEAGFRIVDQVLVDPGIASVYEHGWQSWSPTDTYAVTRTSARPTTAWQQRMRFRPETPAPSEGFQGEGLLVVEPAPGEPARVYSSADPVHDAPSIRAALHGDRLMITANGPVVERSYDLGIGPALAGFADELVSTRGVPLPRVAPTAWCSWYHYFLDVTEADVLANLAAIAAADLPVDVVQVDDGWQAGIGDWSGLSARFDSLSALADRIRADGRRAGIWLAPFVVGADSPLARDHPEWLVGAAGENWGQALYGLDLTHPEVRTWVAEVLGHLRSDGFDYFKLDFLYAGALPGRRHEDVSATTAYRSGLELVRTAVGPDAYLLGCGAPLLPSVGLLDAMRVSPDTFSPDEPAGADEPLRGATCARARRWQHGRFWVNDADCLVARPTFLRRAAWAAVVEQCSGLRSASDRIADLDAWGLETTRRLLGTVPAPTPFVDGGTEDGDGR